MKRFIGISVTLVGIALLVAAIHHLSPPLTTKVEWTSMGTLAALTLRGDASNRDAVREKAQAAYTLVESQLSAWNPNSELCRLSRAGGTNWISRVSATVRPCYDAALRLYEQSNQAFNPFIGKTLRELGVSRGGFYADFDLGAIAKGFAVDLAAAAVERTNNIPDLLIDLGGNIRVVGSGTWRTGVRNPFAKDSFACTVTLTNGESAATSGNYERFIERDGMRLSHILDGRTGQPTHGIAGVTVITPRTLGAMGADGLSTTLFILGPTNGAAFLARHNPAAQALWIPDTPERPRLLVTPNLAPRLENVRWPMDIVRTDSDGKPTRPD